MAKIQRLSIPTDQKMAMLRGQPGHMPAPAVAGDETSAAEASPAPNAEPTPAVAPAPAQSSPPPAPESPAAVVTPPAPAAEQEGPKNSLSTASPRRGPGRPRKADAPAAAPAPAPAATTGLPPSLIRLEGAAQFAALSYVREEMLRGRRVYLKQLVDEAILYYLEHGPPARQGQ